MAMGSSRGRILLAVLVKVAAVGTSIPALMICINMVMADVTFTKPRMPLGGDLSYAFLLSGY